ncbi:MAG TPA: hypothetical protein P5084_01275 [Paludibacter sp.]|nr:hypothetical protein [Paludibacter sp.]
MKETINPDQTITQSYNNFKIEVDFSRGKMSAEFDFKEQKISLENYQSILSEFAEMDRKLSIHTEKIHIQK